MITATWYPSAALGMFAGDINAAHEFRVALLDASGTYDPTDTELGDVDGDELPDAGGYTAGGVVVTVTASSDADETSFTIGNAEWPGADFSADHAVLYDASSGKLLLHIDLDGPVVPDDETLVIEALTAPTIRLPLVV